MQRSDDSGGAQDGIQEETAFIAESSDPGYGSIDSDYFSGDEDDQSTIQALSPEPYLSTDVAKESAPMERADVARQSTANISEIAKRRKESQQADSTSASATPSPDRSLPAPKPTSDIINKPVDVSGVKSVVAAQINATRKTKSTDAIPKKERNDDKRKLGVASTFNEASVIENAFDKLQTNMSNLKVSQDIAKTARKYIASEAKDSKPFLSGPDSKQKEVLRFLGLSKKASERAIRLKLLNIASESAESSVSKKDHEKTMRTLREHHEALFKK